MAKLGLQYPVFAPLTETVGANGAVTVTVGTGFVMGKLVSESTALNLAESNFYADDGLDESVREFVSGTITETFNDLTTGAETGITGAAKKSGENIDGFTNNGENTAPWGRHGFIEVHLRGGARKYKTKIYQRVKYSPPDDDNATKGEQTALTGVSVSGSLSRDQASGNWRDVQWFDTLEAAKTYINTACNIS